MLGNQHSPSITCKKIFVVEYDPTIYQKQVVLDEQCLSVEMLDTAGEEEYGVMLQQYILRSDGCLVVYSITSINSFKEAGLPIIGFAIFTNLAIILRLQSDCQFWSNFWQSDC